MTWKAHVKWALAFAFLFGFNLAVFTNRPNLYSVLGMAISAAFVLIDYGQAVKAEEEDA